MNYPEEVAIQTERDRILKLIDEMIKDENDAYDHCDISEYLGITASIDTLQLLKSKITAV